VSDLELKPAQTERVRQWIAKGRFLLSPPNFGKNLQRQARSEVFYFLKAGHSKVI